MFIFKAKFWWDGSNVGCQDQVYSRMGNSNRSEKSLLMWDVYQEYGIDYGHIRGTNLSDCTLQSFGLKVKSFELKYCHGVWSNFCPKKPHKTFCLFGKKLEKIIYTIVQVSILTQGIWPLI